MQAQSNRTAEAKATHAALVERDERAVGRGSPARGRERRARDQARRRGARICGSAGVRRTELQDSVVASEARLDAGVRTFDEQRERVRDAEERSQTLRSGFDEQDGTHPRGPSRARRQSAAEASRLEVARATAEADLTHLASSCVESVQATLDEVAAEVETLEREGLLASPKPIDDRPDAAEIDDGRRRCRRQSAT